MERKNLLKLGAFVFISFLGFAFVVIVFGKLSIFEGKSNTYYTTFNDIAGLEKGAQVRVNGIDSGKVDDIYLKNGKVIVKFDIKSDIPLYKDASASIGSLGLMGEKYLSITEGNKEFGILKPGSFVENNEGVADINTLIKNLTNSSQNLEVIARVLASTLEQNKEQLNSIIQNTNSLMANLNEVVLENRASLKATIQNLDALTYALNQSLPQTINNIDAVALNLESITSQNKSDIRELVKNLKDLSQTLKEQTPILLSNLNNTSENLNDILVDNKQGINKALTNFSSLSESLKQSSERLNSILAKIDKGQGTLGQLVNNPSLYNNANTALDAFSGAGKVLKQSNLWITMEGELYRAGRTKGILGIKFQPNEDSFFIAQVVGDSQGRVSYEQLYPYGTVVSYQYKPTYTFQYAHIFNDPFIRPGKSQFVIRAGLKESTGGVGLDYVYNRRLTFTSDLWNFGRKDYPGEPNLKPDLQIGATYQVYGPLFVRAGVDDILNSKLTGGFVGAGLVFSDNFLKYILGSLGSLAK